jgi:hypothetical protein
MYAIPGNLEVLRSFGSGLIRIWMDESLYLDTNDVDVLIVQLDNLATVDGGRWTLDG